MQNNDHPQDSIPAFVLGTLDIDEALLVNAHVTECPGCRAEAEAFQALLGSLPYATAPLQPPAHIKQQLLARIAATTPPQRTSTLGRRSSNRSSGATPRWMQAATGGALALSLAFGMMLFDTSSRVADIGNELTKNQQTLTQLNQQHTQDQTAIALINGQHTQDAQAITHMQERIARDQQVTMFISAPETLPRPLAGADRRMRATMYMQPNNPQAVLVIEGMPRAAPGQVYQFWLAKPGLQVPSATFDAADEGLVVVQINAPAPVNQFDQVMVTIEQAGGATQPSDKIVLSAALNTASPASSSRRLSASWISLGQHPSS